MDKYRKVIKKKEENATVDEAEIRVTSQGSVSAYISRAAKVYGELGKNQVVIKATGNALTKAVTTAEVIKRRFKGLHQITNCGSNEVVDEYEPLEEGLDKVTQTRSLPFVEITLSKDALDTNDKGYQAPIDESLVKEMDAEEMMKPRGRGGGRGKGRGKGKGRGRGKGKGRGKGDSKGKGKGKGKGKAAPAAKSKGKGKGKGKEEPKGKSKGKGKGKDAPAKSKGKGKDAPSKGKGKDKGKGKGKDAGKGKGSSKGGGWDYGGKSSSKGKGWGNDWGYSGKGGGYSRGW